MATDEELKKVCSFKIIAEGQIFQFVAADFADRDSWLAALQYSIDGNFELIKQVQEELKSKEIEAQKEAKSHEEIINNEFSILKENNKNKVNPRIHG